MKYSLGISADTRIDGLNELIDFCSLLPFLFLLLLVLLILLVLVLLVAGDGGGLRRTSPAPDTPSSSSLNVASRASVAAVIGLLHPFWGGFTVEDEGLFASSSSVAALIWSSDPQWTKASSQSSHLIRQGCTGTLSSSFSLSFKIFYLPL